MRNLLQNFKGPKAVTVAMYAALLGMAIIVALALMNCGTV